MAKIQKEFNSMGLPMNITRSNPIPLDATSIHYSLSDAQEYATNNPVAYVGQILVVVNEENNISQIYLIKNEAGDLQIVDSGSSIQWESL